MRVNIYNLQGQQIRTSMDRVEEAGVHRLYWDGWVGKGRLVSSGA